MLRFLSLIRAAAALRVHVFDSTLRDGEQGARRTFAPREKAFVASRLEHEVGCGVDEF